ncbi:UNVERIFIED_CONTAM: hypothetical protein NCL1_60928 [Trichonephila clavipes]
MICKNASIMIDYDPSLQDNEIPQSIGRCFASHPHRTPYMLHDCNQTVNMKCFCWRSPDEHTCGGQVLCKRGFIRPDD